MIQVDLFLTYGIGSAFALAAAPATPTAPTDPRQRPRTGLTTTLLFLSLLFVPSGIWLLMRFPAWETMQVSQHPPAWLYALFPAVVVLMGTVGFVVTQTLVRRDAGWAAVLQWIWPVFLVLVILLHGWDGTGLHRALTADPADWPSAAHQPLHTLAAQWISTPVASTLAPMLVGMMFVAFVLLRRERMNSQGPGPSTSHSSTPDGTRFAGTLLGTTVSLCCGAATLLALLIAALGPVIAIIGFTLAMLPFLHSRSALARYLIRCCLPAPGGLGTSGSPPTPLPFTSTPAPSNHDT